MAYDPKPPDTPSAPGAPPTAGAKPTRGQRQQQPPRSPDQPRLSRQQRRRLERELPILSEKNVCSFCGCPFPHASPTAGGFDARGNVVLAGECCAARVAQIFTIGLALNCEQLAVAHQKATADKIFDEAERNGGVEHPLRVNPPDWPWKSDDRAWFEQHPTRSHRARMPFPGEADKEAATTAAGQRLIILVRQVPPGCRVRASDCLNIGLLPLPDDEAVAQALFEVATGHEPVPHDLQALDALVEKYTTRYRG